MRVLITGATGFIGGHLVDALLTSGYEVTAVSRELLELTARFPRARSIGLDVTAHLHPEDWQAHLLDIDVVINAVGIIAETRTQSFEILHYEFPRVLFKACELAGVKRVIQISALGAEANAASRYHASKYDADSYLRALNVRSVIVKPSLVFGAQGKSTEFFRALAAQPVQFLIGQGNQMVQPIHIDDLVAMLVRLTTIELPPAEVAAVGPAPVSFRDMLAGYRQWLGYDGGNSGKLRSISFPYFPMLALARLAGLFGSPYLNADNLRMLQQGNIASASMGAALLGRPPVAFQTALLKNPATDADRWHARLYFLMPLLRWVIAFVWIYTGIISAFVYPVSESYAMLRQVGISGWMLPVNLYGAALLDVALGIAVLLRYRIYLTGMIQLAVITGYTLIISAFLPEYWFHPFGPLVKNIPFVILILIMLATERKQWNT